MTIYEKYSQLEIDGSWIGLEKSDSNVEYFCTPVDAKIIGWENSIHYCFIRGYRDMVFAVNPEQQKVLDIIKESLKLTPMEAPYEYVKSVQEQYNNCEINYSNEYYDALGLERPDGTESDVKPVEFEPVYFIFDKK